MVTSPERVASPVAHYSSLLDEIVGCGDMVLLDPITMETVLCNLKQRYQAKEIYTYIGKVVVSINPYQKLSIYTPEYIEKYRSRNMFELPPHIFAIADDAYRSMRDRHGDQCIIISGESGAGKTEASKLVMQYVAGVTSNSAEVHRVKEQLLQSNPFLEAFGNAKTTRNDNSSRFGKYMDLEFDFKGDPQGGVITDYLLEKTRVVYQAPGERNFHIFYQIITGGSDDVLQMLHLKRDYSVYHYLNHSGCTHAHTIDDRKEFLATLRAMEVLGFDPSEISSVLELLSGILNLGNFQFKGYSLPNGTDACQLQEKELCVQFFCDMFGVSVAVIRRALTQRKVETAKDSVNKPLSEAQAIFARDALSKAVYGRLFTWIIRRINRTIEAKRGGRKVCMGVLDIYGFEIFKHNNFEQFFINYCNEKLQQVFIELVLRQEQDEYVREGIEWTYVDFFDNTVICQLIEHPSMGLLALLDEECLRPGHANDGTFLSKINQKHAEHPHFESRASKSHRSDHTLHPSTFRLVHYAGKVTYEIDGFLDKNRDLLFPDLATAMFCCERPLLKELFSEGNPDNQQRKRPPTAGSQLKSSVAGLISNMMSKNPNYIRCIKPNEYQEAAKFSEPLVQHQVGYLGLMGNIHVRRAGYAYRQLYNDFLARYKMLCKRTWPRWKGSAREGTREILKACRKHSSEYSMGRTKVFLQSPKTVFDLEDRRRDRMQYLATLIQKVYRGHVERQKFLCLRAAQTTVSKCWRGLVCRRAYLQLREAAIVFQKYYRGHQARRELWRMKFALKAVWAVEVISRNYARYKVRKHAKQQWAVEVISRYYIGYKVRKQYRRRFRGSAAKVVVRFFRAFIRYRFLMYIHDHLPSTSPVEKRWPRVPPFFREASHLLRIMHHKWRCRLVRELYSSDPKRKAKMLEKTRASTLFAGKKKLYNRTLPVPFYGDRLSLRSDPRWSKLAAEHNETRVVWADNIIKINRHDGKAVPHVMVVGGRCLYILDPKSFAVKSRVSLSDLDHVSVSAHSDGNCIFHITQDKISDGTHTKGDVILSTPNVVELVTKLHTVIQEVYRRMLPVHIKDSVVANFAREQVQVHFRVSPDAGAMPDCRRKGGVMEFLV